MRVTSKTVCLQGDGKKNMSCEGNVNMMPSVYDRILYASVKLTKLEKITSKWGKRKIKRKINCYYLINALSSS